MITDFYLGGGWGLDGCVVYDVDLASPWLNPVNCFGLGIERLSTDPIGTFTLQLTNVVVGSSLQISTLDFSTIFVETTAAVSNPSYVINTYSVGSPLNDLLLRIRKTASAPFYKTFDNLITSFKGSYSTRVTQLLDQ